MSNLQSDNLNIQTELDAEVQAEVQANLPSTQARAEQSKAGQPKAGRSEAGQSSASLASASQDIEKGAEQVPAKATNAVEQKRKKLKKIPEPDFVPKGYTIQRYLGSGQTADVFLAKHRQHGEIALKLIRPEIQGIYAHTHMFTNEVYLTTRLRHPYVINAYDGDPTENNAFLALEFCAGGTLDGYLTKMGQFDLQESYKLILQIASGLSFSHTRGILHRDVKPANVLLDAKGDARLADFGTGVYIDKVPKNEKVGTAYYMAPEIYKGLSASVQSDIYALGVLAYELLTARRPFQGKTYNEVMQAHLSKIPPNPKHLRNDLDKSVAVAIMKAISGSVDKRYETVLQFKDAIQKAVKVEISENEEEPIQVGRKSRSSTSEKTTAGEGSTLEVATAEEVKENAKPQGFIRRFFQKNSK